MGMEEKREELKARKERVEKAGENKHAKRESLNQNSARERVKKLLDADTFFEMGTLNHSDLEEMEEKTPADGKVCGMGKIEGRPVVVMADDHTVLAGTGGRVGGRKSGRLANLALEKGMPIINLGESGGARIPDIQGSDGLSSMAMPPGLALRNRRVPMAATIMGECFGSPSWHAALADFVVQVKGSCLAVSGPRVLEIATGEKVSSEELGGWELHARTTGLTDRSAETEEEALALVRAFLSYLPSHSEQRPPQKNPLGGAAQTNEDTLSKDRARQEKLLKIIPEKSNRAYDMHEILETLADPESIFPLKPDLDKSVITALGRMDGHPVGFIASNPKFNAGAMGAEGCAKATSFVVLCDSFQIPLIFLHDTPGFFVGKVAETKGMPGKIINFYEALVLASVPKISLIVRKSYGMAYSNFGGTGTGSDFLFAWPTADISFMAPEVAANVVYLKKIQEAPDPEAARAEAIEEMRLGSAPWRAAGKHLIDEVIDPLETRGILIHSLEICRGGPKRGMGKRNLASWPTSF